MAKSRKIEFLVLVVAFLAFANFFVWREVWGVLDGKMEVVFFDVGQGDAIWVETGQGHQILIDGGPSRQIILEKLARTMPFWDRTVDLVVLTHPDYDHLRGLNDVLEKYKVQNVLWTGGEKESKTFQYWLKALELEEKEGAKVYLARAGQVIQAGDTQLFIFYPKENLVGQSVEKWSNDSSIVSKLIFGRTSFLLTGDIGQKIEKRLVGQFFSPSLLARRSFSEGGREGEDERRGRGLGLASDVLKIAHHGSKNSSASEFIASVEPEIAVISCGKNNSYGHPAERVLQTLAEFAITVLRTDELGDIKFVSDGEAITVD